MAKSTDLILRKAVICVGLFSVALSLLFLLLGRSGFALSWLLGVFFSYMTFDQLIKTQEKILSLRKKSLFFPMFMIRLALYAVPVGIAFVFKAKINLIVMLFSLFAFQGYTIIFELRRSYMRVKKKNG